MRVNPDYWDTDIDVVSWGYFAKGKMYDIQRMQETQTTKQFGTNWSHSTAAKYLATRITKWWELLESHFNELFPGKQYVLADGPSLIMLFESAIPAARFICQDTDMELALSATALNDRVVSGVVTNLARAWGNLNSKFLIENVALDISYGYRKYNPDFVAPEHNFSVYMDPPSVSRIVASVRGAETLEELDQALERWRRK